jgi:arylsulfatase A-like enzyme
MTFRRMCTHSVLSILLSAFALLVTTCREQPDDASTHDETVATWLPSVEPAPEIAPCTDIPFQWDTTLDRPTNLLWMSVDTLRKDVLPSFDLTGANDMPNVATLLASGVVAINHVATGNWTVPCITSVESGQGNDDLGLVNYDEEIIADLRNLPNADYIAGVLGGAGYTTYLVAGNNHYDSDEFAYGTRVARNGMTDTEIVDKIIELTELGLPEPWFVHAHFFGPHEPYEPPDAFTPELDELPPWPYDPLNTQAGIDLLRGEWGNYSEGEQSLALQHLWALYRGEIRNTDQEIDRLLGWFEEQGLLERTLVVFWTDHGEGFQERGDAGQAAIGHNIQLFAEENDTIVAYSSPGLTPGCWTGLTSHPDIAPTTLALMGLPTPVSYTGTIIGETPRETNVCTYFFLSGLYQPAIACIDQDQWKVHFHWDGQRWAINREEDAAELLNQYSADPETQARWEDLVEEARRIAQIDNGIELPGSIY